MVVRTVLNGFTVELELELNSNQEPQTKKQRSLDSTDLENNDYELANRSLELDQRDDPYTDPDANSILVARTR